MAIAATPATLDVLPEQGYILRAADAAPLSDIMANMHHIWAYYSPPLVACVYTCEALSARQYRFEIPIIPSVDGLTYTFRHIVTTGPGAVALAIKVEEYSAAAWNTLESAAPAAGASTSVSYTHNDVIPATSTALRVTIDRGAGTCTPQSLLVYRAPVAVATGIKASGFIPYDPGLLGAVGAPINTELLNRPWRSAMALLRDRRQCVLSFVQDDYTDPGGGAGLNVLYPLTTSVQEDDEWIRIGYAVATIPWQTTASIRIQALANVSAAPTADIVRVSQVGGDSVTLDASGSYETKTLAVTADGSLTASVTFEIAAKRTSAGRSTFVHAVIGSWQPGA